MSEVSERIRRLRVVRRWSQKELAEAAGYSTSIISQIENGRLFPSDDHIAGLSKALGYAESYLSAETGRSYLTSRPLFRAYADASKREADARTEACTLAAEYVRMLGLRPLPDLLPEFDLLPHFDGDVEDEQGYEDVALEVRDLTGIEPEGVVGNVIRAAERLGCIVLPFYSELGRHMGLSVRADDLPVICVAHSETVSGDRQRFTVAHEIGHLVLHSRLAPPRDSAEASRIETEANKFAAAFLAPSGPILESLEEVGGKPTLANLTKIKAIWGVSIKSLVGRYKSLGVIDSDQARSLYKQISRRGWNKAEPGAIPLEDAQWLERSLKQRSNTDDLRLAATQMAERIGGNATDLYTLASWELLPDADVVDLTARRLSSTTP